MFREMDSYLFHENNEAPMIKKARVMVVRMISSGPTSINPAPSCMILRTAFSMWVSGKILAALFTHCGAPSRENHTSDKNIMGQEIKFSIPVVNSSLVPREAKINPSAVRLRLPKRKTINRSTYEPATVN